MHRLRRLHRRLRPGDGQDELSRGLIRYTTENALEGQPTRVLRPRVIIYGVLLAAVGVALLASLILREPIRMDIVPDRNALYRLVQSDQVVENVYTLKVMNMDNEGHTYRVTAEGLPGIRVETQPERFDVAPGEVRNVPARVQVDRSDVTGVGADITLQLQTVDGSELRTREETRFHAPME